MSCGSAGPMLFAIGCNCRHEFPAFLPRSVGLPSRLLVGAGQDAGPLLVGDRKAAGAQDAEHRLRPAAGLALGPAFNAALDDPLAHELAPRFVDAGCHDRLQLGADGRAQILEYQIRIQGGAFAVEATGRADRRQSDLKAGAAGLAVAVGERRLCRPRDYAA